MTRQTFTKFGPITLVLLLAASLFGQTGTGGLGGVVADSTGAVVTGATVTLTSKATNQTQTTTTNDAGIYTFVQLQPGEYTLKTTSGSFAPSTLDVTIQVGRVTNANVTLGAGDVSAVVQVTAEAIQTTQSNPDALLNETAIQNLPINGRRFQDFVTLTPTAQVDPSRGQISLAGQKGINTSVNVDGVDYNQPFFGGIRGGERSNQAFTIPQEAIKEFQVVAAGYSAEFGRSSGGIVNAVTKSGNNELDGSAFYLWRPEQLAVGNEYTDALIAQSLAPRGITDPVLSPTQHQFGGSLGGPIVKDRFFLFGSYEQQRFRAPRQIVFNIPANYTSFVTLTPAQQAVLNFYTPLQVPYTQTNDAWAGLVRADWQINNDHRLNGRFSMSRNNALNAAARGETVVDPTTRQALSTNGTEQDRTRIVVSQLVSNFGTSYVNELRFQYAWEERPRLSNSLFPQVVSGFSTIGAGGADTSSFLPNREYDDRYQIADSFTVIKGNHTFKFGGEFSDIFAAQTFGFNQFGQFFASQAATCSATACAFRDNLQGLSNVPVGTTFLGRFDSTAYNYMKQIGNLANGFGVKELAFFGLDDWRINSKLSINYGLRAEAQYNPDPELGNTAVINTVQNTVFPYLGRGVDPTKIADSGWQWGPRVGFAYDPIGDGKTVVRGYAGIYYARTPLIWLAPHVENFRSTPANVSTRVPSLSAINQTTFNTFLGTAAGAQYMAITGCPGPGADPRCVPNTIYRQFAIVGINLNNFALDNLPILTNAHLATIAGALGQTASPFNSAQVIPMDADYKNPRSAQWGIGVERQLGHGLVVGADYTNVSTHRIGRHRDVNIPAPLTGAQYIAFLTANNTPANVAIWSGAGHVFDQIRQSGRNYIAIATPGGFINPATGAAFSFPTGSVTTRARPTAGLAGGISLGSVGLHESTGKSLYRALTIRARLNHKRVHVNAYYTLSRLLSDDDNERQEGVGYADPYDLTREYYTSRLNRENQFVASPLVFLPWGFEASGTIRLISGAPFNPTVGADLNGDSINNDRPLLVPGLPYERNYFTNRGIYQVDVRGQKTFKWGEDYRLVVSAEIFNVLSRANLLVGTSQAPSSATSFGGPGQYCTIAAQLCGLSGGPATNTLFNQTRDPVTGVVLVNNVNPGSQVFSMQFGARFYF